MKILVIFFASLFISESLQAGTIYEELVGVGATTLIDLFTKANLTDVITSEGTVTLFAPINEAFTELDRDLIDALESDDELLHDVLSYHVVPQSLASKFLQEDNRVETLQGSPLHVNLYVKSDFFKGFITANGIRVIKSDWEASNGVIHFVDRVIQPIANESIREVLERQGKFKTLLDAFETANLIEMIDDSTGALTLFAPTDEAFANVDGEDLEASKLVNLLKRHMVEGTLFSKGISWSEHQTLAGNDEKIATQVFMGRIIKVATPNTSGTVTEPDLVATNGVIQVLDTVLL